MGTHAIKKSFENSRSVIHDLAKISAKLGLKRWEIEELLEIALSSNSDTKKPQCSSIFRYGSLVKGFKRKKQF